MEVNAEVIDGYDDSQCLKPRVMSVDTNGSYYAFKTVKNAIDLHFFGNDKIVHVFEDIISGKIFVKYLAEEKVCRDFEKAMETAGIAYEVLESTPSICKEV